MVGRYRSKDGIKYPFDEKESELDKMNHIKNLNLDSIIKDGFKIIVLNHQPGIGKTYSVMNYIMNKSKIDDDFTFFYFTDRHKTIDEHLTRLEKFDKNIVKTFAHWKGFGKHCENDYIETLLQLNISHQFIVDHFKYNDEYEEYKEQFNKNKRVFSPFYYLSSEHFQNNLPQIIFIDERITQIDTYTFDKDNIIKGFKQIKTPSEYIEKVKTRDINFFLNNKVLDNIKTLYQERLMKAVAKKNKNLDKFKVFNPYKFEQYLIWCKIYDYKFDLYSLPLMYKALDVVSKGIPTVVIDATFNRELFTYFLESYNKEMTELPNSNFKGFKDLKVKVLNSNTTNPKTTLYRMRPKGAWPKVSFKEFNETTWKWLLSDLHELRKIFGDANIGIITYKELCWLFESMNFDVEYYGGLRGTNRLENKIVLVIVGTWLPLPPSWEDKEKRKDKDYIDTLVEKYFLIKLYKRDIIKAKIGASLPVEVEYEHLYSDKDSKSRITVSIDSKLNSHENWIGYYGLKGADNVEQYPVNAINSIWFDEIYQAFHRNRGLSAERIIFSYAWYPEKRMMIKTEDNWLPEVLIKYNLRKEFPNTIKIIEESSKEQVNEKIKEVILSDYKKKYKGGVIQQIIKHIELDENVDDIASEFGIHKHGAKRGWDTPPISALKKSYNNLKEILRDK
ncbi:MAG: hypothetical protein ACFFKA_04450 [Candidatus Thorarchaeota archaeon]